MKQKIVGTYEAGFHQFQLVLREGYGGEMYPLPEPGSVPRIKVGADNQTWPAVLEVLIHEITEGAYYFLGVRYKCSENRSAGHDGYLFFLTHDQLSNASAQIAEYLAACLPEFKRAWKKWQKKKRK